MALEDMEDMELLSGSLKYYVSKYRPYQSSVPSTTFNPCPMTIVTIVGTAPARSIVWKLVGNLEPSRGRGKVLNLG